MKIRALVAIQDGVFDSRREALAPGAIAPTSNVPVTQDFDPRKPPIGRADIVVEGTHVYADIDIDDLECINGLWPALGGRAQRTRGEQPDRVFSLWTVTKFDVIELALCTEPNSDPRIPSLT